MSIFKKTSSLDSDLQPVQPEFESMADKVGDKTVEPDQPNLKITKKSNTGKVVFYLVIFLGLIGLITAMILVFSTSDKPVVTDNQQQQTRVSNTQPRNFNLELPDPEPEQETAPESEEQVSVEEAWQAQQQGTMTPHQSPDNQEIDRRLSGSVLLPIDPQSNANQDNGDFTETASYNTPLSNRLQPTITASTTAKRRPDMTYLMKKGTNIGCTLDTKIVTTHPGLTRCLVTKDVYSSTGKVLLVERGSEIIGEQTTSMLQGQAKVFVLWNTITTPHGVTLDIASPSADSLGASGQDAQVDRHFFERFGGAIMLSLIDDGLVILGDKVNESNSTVSYDSTSDTVESMAAEALRNSINIPPTGYVNQGTLLNVMVARDVDFGDVYELVTPYLY